MHATVIGPATVRFCERSVNPVFDDVCPVEPVQQCLDIRGGPFSDNAATSVNALWSMIGGAIGALFTWLAM